MSAVATAYAGMSVLLVAAAAMLVYPAVTGAQVVVYRKAVLALGTSALLFVVGWLVTDLTYHGLVDARVLSVVGALVITLAGVLHLVAIWLFARDFVQFQTDSVSIDVGAGESGGFGDE